MPAPLQPSQPDDALHLADLMQQLLHELESNDPIDFADLATDEDTLRQRCIDHVLRQVVHAHDLGLDPRSTVVTLLTSCAHLLLENVALHARLMQQQSGDPVDVQRLLEAIFRKPGLS